ncbi:hypothetical protein H3R33_02315 [Commensalibacter sp. B14384M2]|uniref:hypothetical protein n=2 Tax=Commensalibacter TaxID=1079922 RepID=UPI0018DEB0E5|nr:MULTISPECIES: hypothetical protein [unclassified Commensalibacter]MBI0016416.1 hypothetical protein [Commensalibacter sp. B14384M2]
MSNIKVITVLLCDQNTISIMESFNKKKELDNNAKKIINLIKQNDKPNVYLSFNLSILESDKKRFPTMEEMHAYINNEYNKIINFIKENCKYIQHDLDILKYLLRFPNEEEEKSFEKSIKNNDFINFLNKMNKILYKDFPNEKALENCKKIIKIASQYNLNPFAPIVMSCILIACKHKNISGKSAINIKHVFKFGENFNAYNAFCDVNNIHKRLLILKMDREQEKENCESKQINCQLLTADKSLKYLDSLFEYQPNDLPTEEDDKNDNKIVYISYNFDKFTSDYFPALDKEKGEYKELLKLLSTPPNPDNGTDGVNDHA